jgi:hypothetical protein
MHGETMKMSYLTFKSLPVNLLTTGFIQEFTMLFVFLALQPIVFVFSQPGSGL